MNTFRKFYRNIFIEITLLSSIAIQIVLGIRHFIANRKKFKIWAEKLKQWAGLYLLFFLLIHLGAVFGARFLLLLDTNFYFGVVGINTFPFNLFFIPYYAAAVISFFGLIASIHAIKIRRMVLGLTPTHQAKVIIAFGFAVTLVLFYGFTNGFKGVEIPKSYSTMFK